MYTVACLGMKHIPRCSTEFLLQCESAHVFSLARLLFIAEYNSMDFVLAISIFMGIDHWARKSRLIFFLHNHGGVFRVWIWKMGKCGWFRVVVVIGGCHYIRSNSQYNPVVSHPFLVSLCVYFWCYCFELAQGFYFRDLETVGKKETFPFSADLFWLCKFEQCDLECFGRSGYGRSYTKGLSECFKRLMGKLSDAELSFSIGGSQK